MRSLADAYAYRCVDYVRALTDGIQSRFRHGNLFSIKKFLSYIYLFIRYNGGTRAIEYLEDSLKSWWLVLQPSATVVLHPGLSAAQDDCDWLKKYKQVLAFFPE